MKKETFSAALFAALCAIVITLSASNALAQDAPVPPPGCHGVWSSHDGGKTGKWILLGSDNKPCTIQPAPARPARPNNSAEPVPAATPKPPAKIIIFAPDMNRTERDDLASKIRDNYGLKNVEVRSGSIPENPQPGMVEITVDTQNGRRHQDNTFGNRTKGRGVEGVSRTSDRVIDRLPIPEDAKDVIIGTKDDAVDELKRDRNYDGQNSTQVTEATYHIRTWDKRDFSDTRWLGIYEDPRHEERVEKYTLVEDSPRQTQKCKVDKPIPLGDVIEPEINWRVLDADFRDRFGVSMKVALITPELVPEARTFPEGQACRIYESPLKPGERPVLKRKK